VLRKSLRPADCPHIVIEVFRAFFEVGEVGIRQPAQVDFRILFREFDVAGTNGVAYTPRTRMQHHPDHIRFIEADLDEVVARTERTEVIAVVGIAQPRLVLTDAIELLRE